MIIAWWGGWLVLFTKKSAPKIFDIDQSLLSSLCKTTSRHKMGKRRVDEESDSDIDVSSTDSETELESTQQQQQQQEGATTIQETVDVDFDF